MRTQIGAVLVVSSLVLASNAFSQGTGADSQGHMGHGMKHGETSQSSSASKAAFDQQFLDTMSMHHQHGIEMAQIAEKNASHDELKQMAKKMIDDQQKDIEKMKAMKQQWYADKGDAMNMNMPGMESMKGMSMDKLQAAKGDAFDAMFIDMMNKHHQGGIKMAQGAVTKAQHADVKEMARKIVAKQKKEMAQMAKWKKEWKLASN